MRLLARLLSSIIKEGDLQVIDAEGKVHAFGNGKGERCIMRLHDPKLYRDMVFKTEMAVGEGYMDGKITFEDGTTLKNMLSLYNGNRRSVKANPWIGLLASASRKLKRWQQSNKVGEAQSHVSHHYDIGNEFYKLFLDKNLLYSCAYFRDEKDSLETAQRNKLRLLASKLNLKSGQKVLDIGCGWGDLALYIAQLVDVDVTGVTLSKEQCELANERAKKMGLSHRVRFELKDYRLLDQKFDRIVSVGMFEHVGVHHYDEFFKKVDSLLPDDGVMVLHSIGHMSPPGTASPWLRKYIFPGAYSPAMSEVFPIIEKNRLWVMDMEVLRLHYAYTLAHWTDRFEKNRAKIVEMFDERFARMWEFYLVSCDMMFRSGAQMVFHLQLSRSRDSVPLQRDYIVQKQEEYEALEKKLKIEL